MTTVGIQKTKKRLRFVAFPRPANLAEHDGALLAANGGGNAPFIWHDALYPRHVFLFDLALLHGVGKQSAAVGVFGYGQSPARFSVKAAYGAKHKGAVAVAVSQGVGQGVLSVAVRGMGGHPRRLGADYHVLVLVENGDGKGNGGQVGIDGLLRVSHGKRETVARPKKGAYRYSFSVQENTVLLLFKGGQKTGGDA